MGVIYSGNEEAKVFMLSVSETEYEEFKELLRRGCNTWDTKPQWIRTVADALECNPSQSYGLEVIFQGDDDWFSIRNAVKAEIDNLISYNFYGSRKITDLRYRDSVTGELITYDFILGQRK